ncbi:MAG: hypothetical protein AB1374_02920 [Bacillota bacterium]
MATGEKDLLLNLIKAGKAVYVQPPKRECRRKGICIDGPTCELFPTLSRYPSIRGLCRSKPKDWERRWRRILDRHSEEAAR